MGLGVMMKNVLGSPAHVIPLYTGDDSGQLPIPMPGSRPLPENRIRYFHWKAAHQHLNGNEGLKLGERYMDILSRAISADTSIGAEWVEMPDLFLYIRNLVFPAGTESLCGSSILALHPTLTEDFWAFAECLPTLLRGLPRWLSPSAHRKRDKMLKMVKEWHAYAYKRSDFFKTGSEDPDWDPDLGTKYVKARQTIFHGIEVLDADGRASEDLGLLFG